MYNCIISTQEYDHCIASNITRLDNHMKFGKKNEYLCVYLISSMQHKFGCIQNMSPGVLFNLSKENVKPIATVFFRYCNHTIYNIIIYNYNNYNYLHYFCFAEATISRMQV